MRHGYFTDKGLPESKHGYRCQPRDPMPEGKKNVVVLGCSHTWGVGNADNEHWVYHLSRHNTERLRYWNLGQPGASADKIVRILFGCEKLIDPRVVIVCWPSWSRRERLGKHAESLFGDARQLALEDDDTDKHNFLKNVFLVEKYGEKNNCKIFHCFAQESYHEHIKGLNVLEEYTLANCWPYWDRHHQRVQYKDPSLAADGQHYGVEHHKRFAQLFLDYFGKKLK
jgi:hypothetical protein